jgi:hypothetical protein
MAQKSVELEQTFMRLLLVVELLSKLVFSQLNQAAT